MAVIPEGPDNDHQAQESDPGSGSGSEEKARESEHEEETPDLEEKKSDHHDDDNPEMEKGKRPAENPNEGGCNHVSKMGTLGSETPSGFGSSSGSGPNQDIPLPNLTEEPIEHRTDEQRSCANGDHGGDVNSSGDEANGGHEYGDDIEYENVDADDDDNDFGDYDYNNDDDMLGDAQILQGLVDYIAANRELPMHNPFAILDFAKNWLHVNPRAWLIEDRIAELSDEYFSGELTYDPELLPLCQLIWGYFGTSEIVSINDLTSSVGSGYGPPGSESQESGSGSDSNNGGGE